MCETIVFYLFHLGTMNNKCRHLCKKGGFDELGKTCTSWTVKLVVKQLGLNYVFYATCVELLSGVLRATVVTLQCFNSCGK